MATVFNLGQVAQQTRGGYDRSTRVNLSGEALIKVKETAVKKVLSPPLTSTVQVSSFEPSEINDKENFFNFVGDWRTSSLTLSQHLTAYYMQNVFIVARIEATPQIDPVTNVQAVDSQGLPIFNHNVVEDDSLFDSWHNLSKQAVAESVRIYAEHAEDVDRQNLQWSWEFILNNVDQDLRHYVLSEVEDLPEHIGHTGPMAFYIIATKIVTGTSNLSHNIISGIMSLELTHFDGEDVTECVYVLRNVLKFLNHGHPQFDKTPPTVLENLFDVFLKASNFQFVTYVQNLRDFHRHVVNSPESLFSRVQDYYNKILTNPNTEWLPTHKAKGSFLAGGRTPKDDSKPTPSPNPITPDGKQPYVVDRNPPLPGEPRTRKSPTTGKTEHWCGRCPHGGRWGNHQSNQHDEWYKSFLEKKKKKDGPRSSDSSVTSHHTRGSRQPSSNGSTSGQPPPAPVGQVSYSKSRTPLFNPNSYVSFMGSDEEDF